MNSFFHRAVFFLILAASSLVSRARAETADQTLKVYWIDCDGGCSTLIVTPQHESILIDAGFPGPRDPARIVAAAKDAGVAQIDHFILTHFHRDHFGGAPFLVQTMPIVELYDQGIPKRTLDWDGGSDAFFDYMVRPYAAMQVGKRNLLKPGMIFPLKSDAGAKAALQLRCLGVAQQFVAPPPGQEPNPLATTPGPEKKLITSENQNSAVVLLSFGRFRFYIGGDLNWYQEERLVSPYNLVGPVDVFQVDTHGLATSNPPILLRSLTPTVAVINNGAKKGAALETINRIKAEPSIKALYQVHLNATIEPEQNPGFDYVANIDEGCAGNYIKMVVAADGDSYTVSIPAKGFSQTYQTKR